MFEILSARLSRRDFLKAAVGISFVASGCEADSDEAMDQRSGPVTQVENSLDQGSIYRAASIKMANDFGYGTASLVSLDNDLYLYTTGHVVKGLLSDPESILAEITGINRFKLDPIEFILGNMIFPRQIEPLAYYPLEKVQPKPLEQIKREINLGKLSPLVFAKNKPAIYEETYIPRIDTGEIQKFNFLSYVEDLHAYMLMGGSDRSGMVCKGMSGSPCIRASGGNMTNQIYGVLQGAFRALYDRDESGKSNNYCSQAGVVIPNRYQKIGPIAFY